MSRTFSPLLHGHGEYEVGLTQLLFLFVCVLFFRWTHWRPQCHQRHSPVHFPQSLSPHTHLSDHQSHATLSSPIVYQHRESPSTILEDSFEHVHVYYSGADRWLPFVDWGSSDFTTRPVAQMAWFLNLWTASAQQGGFNLLLIYSHWPYFSPPPPNNAHYFVCYHETKSLIWSSAKLSRSGAHSALNSFCPSIEIVPGFETRCLKL